MLTITQIENSLQSPNAIKDPVIKLGSPIKKGIRSKLVKYAGGCAVVFPFRVNGEQWSFRCWTADLGNVERRLTTLSQGLNKLQLPYFTPFFYVSEGIEVDGRLYPTTRMKWIEGTPINEYLCENKNNPELLYKLADDFMRMCKVLHDNKISHGDLQHGNILINSSGSIVLIDYDSVYISELNDSNDIIKGLPDYQHPKRVDNKYSNEKLDYFSELIIYLSIVAIAEDSSLVEKCQLQESERMLFSAADFIDLEHSEMYHYLKTLSDKVRSLLSILKDYLKKSSILDLEPFDVVFGRMKASLTLSKEKIRKSKETARLSWKVVSETEKIILLANGIEVRECDAQGFIDVSPEVDTEYCLKIYYSDKTNPDERKVKLLVRSDACVKFYADKEYTIPKVPLTLFWNVQNAISVKYDGQDHKLNDSIIIKEGIEAEKVFSIFVTDEFETKEYFTKVQLLPVPVVKTLISPTPDIESSINIQADMPIQFKDSQLITLNSPTLRFEDIENIAQQMPKVTEFPVMNTPIFDIPQSVPEKMDESINGFISNVQTAITVAIQKCKKMLNRLN